MARKIRIEYAGAAYAIMKESPVAFRRLCQGRDMKTAIDRRLAVGGFETSIRLPIWGLVGFGLVPRAAAPAQAGTGGFAAAGR